MCVAQKGPHLPQNGQKIWGFEGVYPGSSTVWSKRSTFSHPSDGPFEEIIYVDNDLVSTFRRPVNYV